jgi:hypothetical protein
MTDINDYRSMSERGAYLLGFRHGTYRHKKIGLDDKKEGSAYLDGYQDGYKCSFRVMCMQWAVVGVMSAPPCLVVAIIADHYWGPFEWFERLINILTG